MTKYRLATSAFALACLLLLAGGTAFHLELSGSHPEADAVIDEAPREIWLRFSVVPDMDRTSFSVRGPDGNVELSEMTVGEDPEIVRAEVTGEMPAGDYTLSWVGAPMDDHTVRGRFTFSIQEIQR